MHAKSKTMETNETNETTEDPDVKVILLGDSAVGKSKLIERYLEDDYNPKRVRKYHIIVPPKLSRRRTDDFSSITCSQFPVINSCINIIPQRCDSWRWNISQSWYVSNVTRCCR